MEATTMSALLRFWWFLCFAVMASAMSGACAPAGGVVRHPNIRVHAPRNERWAISAIVPPGEGREVPLVATGRLAAPFSRLAVYEAEVRERPSQVHVSAVDGGLGPVNCSQFQVLARLSGRRHDWAIVKIENAHRSDSDRNTCILKLSWPRE